MKDDKELFRIYDPKLFNLSDFDVLLHEILKQTRSILNSEAGSIYIHKDNSLCFNVFQNDALSYENIYKQFYSLKDVKLPLSEHEKYLAVQSFVSNKIIVIDDVYKAKEYDFLGVKEFDEKFNYRTKSIITAPIIHPIENKILGVVQLLNKSENDELSTYTNKDKETLSMASSFMAISISKAQDDIEKLKLLNEKLEIVNKDLSKRVEKEIEESKKKSLIIYHQSKLVSMGEMIGNIAHQWRQPLSAISTMASGLSFNIEVGKFQEEEARDCLDKIVKNTIHLSQTIEDFRAFYNIDKQKREFNLAKNILSSITITEASLSENHITIYKELDESLNIFGYENEFKQAVLNIVQNAKEAILNKIPRNNPRFIFISLYKKDDEIVVKIKDNAGGIDEEHIENIFEQNFTTKHSDGGTGIGLYMTKEIIEDHMLGKVSACNETYEFNDVKYTGAVFTIKFNLNSSKNL